MRINHLRTLRSLHWFWIYLVLVAGAGYQFGKDRALRDNAIEQAGTGQVSSSKDASLR
jgi:hypothetical protein